MFSAARMWWLFRLMGKTDVAVLDGGLPKWRAEGRPVEDVEPVLRDRHMTVSRQNQLVRDVTQVARDVKLGTRQVVDARSPARFRGEEPEPRPGLRSGHIPGALNVHYRDASERRRHDEGSRPACAPRSRPRASTSSARSSPAAARASPRRSCRSRSSVSGHADHALYDGSWSEWGMYPRPCRVGRPVTPCP